MRSITYTATVGEDRNATIALPSDILPGVYDLRIYVEEKQPKALQNPFQGLPTVHAWEGLKDVSLRREDIYGDEGRKPGIH